MTNQQKLSGLTLLFQVTLWIMLLIIYFVILPKKGFVDYYDFNNPDKIATAPVEMVLIVWSDLLFGLSTLITIFVLHQYMRTRVPQNISRLVSILLAGIIGWFVLHDFGIHVIGWSAIERNPASTNYAMDRVLWSFRNGIFLLISIFTFIASSSDNQKRSRIM
jgi:hypothetical protein